MNSAVSLLKIQSDGELALKHREKVVKQLVLIIVSQLLVNAAFGAGVATARVVNVRIDQSGKGIVYFDQNLVGSPGCVVATYENGLAFDTSTAGGKAIMARALAAMATGDLVKVTGTGTCAIYGNSWVEDWGIGDFE